MAEAVMVLPVLALLWVGLLYVHRVARHLQAAEQHARERAWHDGFNGCRDDNQARRSDCSAAFSLELKDTKQSAVDKAGRDLFGGWTGYEARTEFARPAWLGGGEVRIGAKTCVPCNPVPKESFEVVRQTYDDNH